MLTLSGMAKRGMIIGCFVVIFVGSLMGCKGGPAVHVVSAQTPTLESGWTTARSEDGKVSIGVPPGWRVGADTAGNSISDLMKQAGGGAGGGNPQLGQDLQQMASSFDEKNKKEEADALDALAKKGIILNVINGSKPIPGEKRTRFYVLVKHLGGSVSRDDAINSEREHYAFKPKMLEVKLPIGPAVKCVADDTLRDGGSLHQISYLVIDGGDLYSLRFVTEEAAETITSIAETVAGSLRIKPTN
jgi:hypothetical protein